MDVSIKPMLLSFSPIDVSFTPCRCFHLRCPSVNYFLVLVTWVKINRFLLFGGQEGKVLTTWLLEVDALLPACRRYRTDGHRREYDALWGQYSTLNFVTLIVLGQVKIDLAEFDVKLLTNFLCMRKNYSCRNVLQIFLNFTTGHPTMMFLIHFNEFTSKIWHWQPCEPYHFWWVL